MIGFASDGVNVMLGSKNSVKTLFKRKIKGLFVMKCVCHSLAFCCSYACEKIHDGVEHLIRRISNYMKYSHKRKYILLNFKLLSN